MKEYEIEKAFQRIEKELIHSMVRNLNRHRAEETELGYNWEQWQVKQLQALEDYKKRNKKRFKRQFYDINQSIDTLIQIARQDGNLSQEKEVLEAIRKGYQKKPLNSSTQTSGEFFQLNTKKLEALITATKKDFLKAEQAILRRADDQYRKIIFDAQVYANTGTGTYEKAVDMATKDFLSHGINCIEYANGARHTIADYAYMAIQTACKRAYLTGEGEKRREWGISTVIVNKRGNPCPNCLPFCEKILIDDVWSGGSKEDGNYLLMSEAIQRGLYHPRCKDSHTTYFEGISTPPDNTFTRAEIKEIENNNKKEAKGQYINRQIEKYQRLETYSLDNKNKADYHKKVDNWSKNRNELSQEEKGAVTRYISPDSYSLNDKLRRKEILTDFEKGWIMKLNQALDKLPNYEGNLNRTVTFALDDDAKRFYDSFVVSEKYAPKQYLSATKQGIYNVEGQVQIYIQNAKNGKDLTGFNDMEQEVLYKSDATFKIINKVEKNGIYFILIEEEL